jgi:inhibitor of cysteine peptidase
MTHQRAYPAIALLALAAAIAACADSAGPPGGTETTPPTAAPEPTRTPAPDEIHLTAADNGQAIEANRGDMIVVALPSNPTTGYQWDVVSEGNVLRQSGESEYIPDEPPDSLVDGAGGTAIFRFEATGAGSAELALEYHRPWEEVDPIDLFAVTVTVN